MNHYHHKSDAKRHFSRSAIDGILSLALAGFSGWSLCDGAVVATLASAVLSGLFLLGFFKAAESYRKSARLAKQSKPIKVERL